jgi:hypothetical protein
MVDWVVDRNMVRRQEFSVHKDNPEASFVLPDTFFIEAVKNSNHWRETLRRDLEVLMPVRDRTRISCSISEALRIEIDQTRSITRDEWLSRALQDVLDRLFDAVSRGGESYLSATEIIQEILESLWAEQPAAANAKSRTEDTVEKLRGLLGVDELANLRAGRIFGDAKLGLVEFIARNAYYADCKARETTLLSWPASLTARFWILKFWRNVWWLQNGGLDDAKDQSLHNDQYDDEYILIGSFFDGVLSLERRVQEAKADLMRIVAVDSAPTVVAAFDNWTRRG